MQQPFIPKYLLSDTQESWGCGSKWDKVLVHSAGRKHTDDEEERIPG